MSADDPIGRRSFVNSSLMILTEDPESFLAVDGLGLRLARNTTEICDA